VLDVAFAGTGYVIRTATAGPPDPGNISADQANAISIDSQQRIVVAGASKDATGRSHPAAWRLTPAGTFDASFGNGGAWLSGYSTDQMGAYGLALDALDRSYVVAEDDPLMELTRVDASGVLDTSFGATGVGTVTSLCTGAGTDVPRAVKVRASGAIDVVGGNNTGPDVDMAAWRFTADGQVDSTFASLGGCVVAKSTAGQVPSNDLGQAVTEDLNHNLVVAGYSTQPNGRGVCALWRYLPAGLPDPSFGTNGAVTISAVGAFYCASITAVVADPAGGLWVAGDGNDSSPPSVRAFAAHLTTAGAIDPTFGTEGFVFLAPEPASASGLAIDSKGRIVIAGELFSLARNSVAVWRLSSTGVLDSTFGEQGVFSMSGTAGGVNDGGNAVAVDAQDRPVVAGISTGTEGNYVAIWRLTP
jgi:uncharacterized delta-60 repeat protein